MADKIVQLIDKNGDNVFPVTVSTADNTVTSSMLQGNSVTTAKIISGAITAAKLAQYAASEGVATAANLEPSSDTPSAWSSLFGGEDGLYVTHYSVSGKFSHQPSQYGELVTIRHYTDTIQFWLQYNKPMMYRYGNSAGWESAGAGGSSFVTVSQILSGTSAPSSNLGYDGDIYVRYSA